MFILHSSNKTENLLEHLVSVIEHAPLQSPFSKELFLIQSQGMERWLAQQLASRFDVWANYEFLFPSHFFSTIAQQVDSRLDDEAFGRQLILWRLEAILRDLQEEVFAPLAHYLAGTNPSLKRYQLARHLAQIFDQYQIMRPDLLAAWQQGRLLYYSDVERWQQALWLRLINQIGRQHRGALWLEVIDKLNNLKEGALAGRLPERISVFGINTMPPIFLKYLQSVSKHCDVHLFLLNPAQDYWADLAGKRNQGDDDDNNNGHPLLVSLGQQGREFQEMLLDYASFAVEPSSFEAIPSPNNLQQLQNDILNNAVVGRVLMNDGSLRIHACHSRKREVEILRDQLLMALENDPALELRDIAVMAPDIQLYEPFISAVFSDIQHAIADRSQRQENQALDAFIRFLALSQSRLGWQSVMDLLERPEIYPNFGLSDTDLELIEYWVKDTNVRWGQSGQHKQEYDLPELHEYTWQAALDRLLMGLAVNHENAFIDGILPYSAIEGSSAESLGGLHDFLQLLFQAKAELKTAKPLKSWGLRLTYFAGQLLGSAERLNALAERQQLNEILMDLTGELADIHTEPVELAVLIQWLEGMVAERKSGQGFLRGQLTFCSMLPMRSIPFKIIALMGINEGEFPNLDRQPTFDLIAQHFRKGDRSRRADDRYQFLEILLSARQQLIITYTGQSQATNEPIAPSVVVAELLDVLQEYYQLTGLVIKHPLQAFNSRYFDGSSRELFSFSQTDCDTANDLAGIKQEASVWWQGAIDATQAIEILTETVIDVADMFRFYQHPQRYFMRQQLGLRFNVITAETEEREPFSTGELGLYGLYQEWLEQLLMGKDMPLHKLQAQGWWPAGNAGAVAFEQNQDALQTFAETINAVNLGKPVAGLAIDININGFRLRGTLNHRYENGSLFYRYAKLKGKDFITAWLHHLLINRIEPQETMLICNDETLRFKQEYCQPDLLPAFIDLYRQGRQRPDAFFTEVAFAYITQALKTKAKKSPKEVAVDYLTNVINNYEGEQELRQLYCDYQTDISHVVGDSFTDVCEKLLLRVWRAVHEN
ncbi:MAG: exodeoxyribonuclease V subunit gamma [Gammaproteobacteria bacterium]|nr:exodeoxyribonuclease V subunit gamma [Gammaproteobacteria bacterium]